MLLTFEAYLLAWGIYLLAAFGFVYTFTWMLGPYRQHVLAEQSRLLLACLLLVPCALTPDDVFYAPAWLIFSFELLFEDNADLLRVAQIILLVCFSVALVHALIRKWKPAAIVSSATAVDVVVTIDDANSQVEPA